MQHLGIFVIIRDGGHGDGHAFRLFKGIPIVHVLVTLVIQLESIRRAPGYAIFIAGTDLYGLAVIIDRKLDALDGIAALVYHFDFHPHFNRGGAVHCLFPCFRRAYLAGRRHKRSGHH